MTVPPLSRSSRLFAYGVAGSVLVIPFLGRADAEDPAVYRALFDRADLSQFVLDQRGHIRRANPSANRLFGTVEVQLRGRPFSDLLTQGTQAGFAQALAATRGPRTEWGPIRLEGRSPSGSVFPIEVEVCRVVHGAEESYGVVVRDAHGGTPPTPRGPAGRFNPGQMLIASRIQELV